MSKSETDKAKAARAKFEIAGLMARLEDETVRITQRVANLVYWYLHGGARIDSRARKGVE